MIWFIQFSKKKTPESKITKTKSDKSTDKKKKAPIPFSAGPLCEVVCKEGGAPQGCC